MPRAGPRRDPDTGPSDRTRGGESPAGERDGEGRALLAPPPRGVTGEEREMLLSGPEAASPDAALSAPASTPPAGRSFWSFGEERPRDGAFPRMDGRWSG